jgi:hypothetical protein
LTFGLRPGALVGGPAAEGRASIHSRSPRTVRTPRSTPDTRGVFIQKLPEFCQRHRWTPRPQQRSLQPVSCLQHRGTFRGLQCDRLTIDRESVSPRCGRMEAVERRCPAGHGYLLPIIRATAAAPKGFPELARNPAWARAPRDLPQRPNHIASDGCCVSPCCSTTYGMLCCEPFQTDPPMKAPPHACNSASRPPTASTYCWYLLCLKDSSERA